MASPQAALRCFAANGSRIVEPAGDDADSLSRTRERRQTSSRAYIAELNSLPLAVVSAKPSSVGILLARPGAPSPDKTDKFVIEWAFSRANSASSYLGCLIAFQPAAYFALKFVSKPRLSPGAFGDEWAMSENQSLYLLGAGPSVIMKAEIPGGGSSIALWVELIPVTSRTGIDGACNFWLRGESAYAQSPGHFAGQKVCLFA